MNKITLMTIALFWALPSAADLRYIDKMFLNGAGVKQLKDSDNALFQGAYANDPAKISQALADGANIYAQDQWGYTPFHMAAAKGHAAAVKTFLKRIPGVDVRSFNNLNHTPLSLACMAGKNATAGHAEVVSTLIASGADVNVVCSRDFTPLRLTMWFPNTTIAKILLKNNARLDARSNGRMTILEEAAKREDPTMALLFLQHIFENLQA